MARNFARLPLSLDHFQMARKLIEMSLKKSMLTVEGTQELKRRHESLMRTTTTPKHLLLDPQNKHAGDD